MTDPVFDLEVLTNRSIRSSAKVIWLHTVLAGNEPQTVVSLMERFGYNQASIWRLLNELVEHGYVTKIYGQRSRGNKAVYVFNKFSKAEISA